MEQNGEIITGVDYDKQAYFEMTESLSILRQVASMVNAIMWVYDAQRKTIIFANKQLDLQLGQAIDESLPAEAFWQKMVARDDLNLATRKINMVAESGNIIEPFNCTLLHQNGLAIPYTIHCSRVENNSNGHLILFTAERLNWDEEAAVIALYKAQKLIKESERMLSFGTFEWDLLTGETLWSDGMYPILGYDKERNKLPEHYNFYIKHIVADDQEKIEAMIADIIQNKTTEPSDISYRIKTGSGDIKHVSTAFRLITDKNGKMRKIVSTTRDLTSSKDAEERMAEQVIELNRSNQELEEFAYVASHDLQEPLRKISTFISRIQSKFGEVLQAEGTLYLNRIMVATDDMRALIDNLLDFSRIIRIDHKFVSTNLNTVLKDVCQDLELIVEETGTTINVAEMPAKVQGVPGQLKQLFSNIISNAIKFRKADVPPQVDIITEDIAAEEAEKYKLVPDKKYYKITISDNGIGFEDEYAEQIFKIFQRLHGKSEYPGSGIGLAICKKIVDYHQGRIYAENVVGKGARFSIILPEKTDKINTQ